MKLYESQAGPFRPTGCMTPNNYKILQNGFVLAATIEQQRRQRRGCAESR
jgi:hypothetical protein